MAVPSLLLLLLVSLLPLVALSSATSTQHQTPAPHDLCVAADVRGLSTIALSAAAANASAAASAASSLATDTAASSDPTLRALLRTCADKYADARDALRAARDSIGQENYDYASVHVSAAAEYPAVCRTMFRRQRPGAYPPELARWEVGLQHLCNIALDIISLLS